jgi:hypothetical protein
VRSQEIARAAVQDRTLVRSERPRHDRWPADYSSYAIPGTAECDIRSGRPWCAPFPRFQQRELPGTEDLRALQAALIDPMGQNADDVVVEE